MRNAVPGTWPQTYAALCQWGLCIDLVDWLEHCLAFEYAEPKVERVLVDSFLYALFLGEPYQAIMQPAGFFMALKAKWAQILTQGRNAGQLATDPELLEDLAGYLDGVTAERWPEIMSGSPEALDMEEDA